MNTNCNGLVNASSQAVCRSRVLNLVLGDITDKRFINSLKKEGDRELCRPICHLSILLTINALNSEIRKRREIYNKTEILFHMIV